MADRSIVRFKQVIASAGANLQRYRSEINDMNVFPVADGDTGDNMTHTLQAVLDELESLDGQSVDEIGRDEIVAAVARSALLGARGNSGVILSQILRGAADELVSRSGELVDPVLLAAAFSKSAEAAYESVREPAEGTMLTVIREMAHRATQELTKLSNPRLQRGVEPSRQDRLLAEVLEKVLETGYDSVERGPQLLPVLREAGVKDSGGYALTVIMEGIVAALKGRPVQECDETLTSARPVAVHLESATSRYRYCTNFVVSGFDLDRDVVIGRMESIGDSVIVVGDQKILRVHLHTDESTKAVNLCSAFGEISHLDLADMKEQIVQRQARLRERSESEAGVDLVTGVVAVASGAGMERLYIEFGAEIVSSGPSLNPSTEELLSAVHSIEADEIVLLPNSINVVMAAERAAELSEKRVEIVITGAQQAGLSALLAYEPHLPARLNAERMRKILKAVSEGSVAPAARDDKKGRFKAGDTVGFISERLAYWGEPAYVLKSVLCELAEGKELLTVFEGKDVPLDGHDLESLIPEGPEIELLDGGQPSFWWLMTAE